MSIVVGLALPQFAAAARPLLAFTIFTFVMLTFARAEVAAVRALLRSPKPLIIACVWLIAAPVVIIGLVLTGIGRDNLDPGLVLGLAVMAGAPPIMSAPAVAMMLGLEPTLLLSAVLVTTAFAPIVSPVLVEFVAGAAVPLDITVLIQRLLLLDRRSHRWRSRASENCSVWSVSGKTGRFSTGSACLMYFLFAVAAMDGVLEAAVAMPWKVAQFLVFSFLMAALGFLASWFVLRALPAEQRFVLGYGTGQRNMGMLIAALGAAAPKTTFLFFALAQVPIYLMPQIIKPLAKRFSVDKGA